VGFPGERAIAQKRGASLAKPAKARYGHNRCLSVIADAGRRREAELRRKSVSVKKQFTSEL
jgi:hypothetical protein